MVDDGWQRELPEDWLEFGNPWEFQRPEVVYNIHFGGHVEHVDDRGRDIATWHPAETVEAMAYDTPIVGWRGQRVHAPVVPHRLDARGGQHLVDGDAGGDVVVRREDLDEEPRSPQVDRVLPALRVIHVGHPVLPLFFAARRVVVRAARFIYRGTDFLHHNSDRVRRVIT